MNGVEGVRWYALHTLVYISSGSTWLTIRLLARLVFQLLTRFYSIPAFLYLCILHAYTRLVPIYCISFYHGKFILVFLFYFISIWCQDSRIYYLLFQYLGGTIFLFSLGNILMFFLKVTPSLKYRLLNRFLHYQRL